MRRLIIVLTILVSSFGFICMAGASPALAANCTPSQNYISWTGYLTYTGYVSGCTDVDLVELGRNIVPPGECGGIRDLSYSPSQGFCNVSPPTLIDSLWGRQYTSFTGTAYLTYYVPAYCGHATHVVYHSMIWRIHGKAQQAWGPWHVTYSPNEAIIC